MIAFDGKEPARRQPVKAASRLSSDQVSGRDRFYITVELRWARSFRMRLATA